MECERLLSVKFKVIQWANTVSLSLIVLTKIIEILWQKYNVQVRYTNDALFSKVKKILKRRRKLTTNILKQSNFGFLTKRPKSDGFYY